MGFEYLDNYRDFLTKYAQWVDVTNPCWLFQVEQPEIDNETLKAMKSPISALYKAVGNESKEVGVNDFMEWLKGEYIEPISKLIASLPTADGDVLQSCRLDVWDTFLQLLANRLFKCGGDIDTIENVTGKRPQDPPGDRVPAAPNSLGESTHTNTESNNKWQQILKDLLPHHPKTDEAIIIFQRAIDARLMEKTDTGLKWKLTQTSLAYLCGIIFCGDTKEQIELTKEYIIKKGSSFFPDEELKQLFGVKTLGQLRHNKDTLPQGYEIVDRLFG